MKTTGILEGHHFELLSTFRGQQNYCLFWRRNTSMRTRGLYEFKHHFQGGCHFRADQRFKEKYCPKRIRGRDERMLYGSKLDAQREFYMELDVPDLDVPDLDFKSPFYYDVMEGKPFTFTTEESPVRIQINLLMTFLTNVRQLWALEDYWTQVGIAIGHSASIADLNCSPAHIPVSNFAFASGVFCICGVFILLSIYGHRNYCITVFFVRVGNKTGVVPLFSPYVFISGSSA